MNGISLVITWGQFSLLHSYMYSVLPNENLGVGLSTVSFAPFESLWGQIDCIPFSVSSTSVSTKASASLRSWFLNSSFNITFCRFSSSSSHFLSHNCFHSVRHKDHLSSEPLQTCTCGLGIMPSIEILIPLTLPRGANTDADCSPADIYIYADLCFGGCSCCRY